MRELYIVNATQVVTSESHPEGMYSTISGYPKTFDSRNYNATEQNPNGDEEKALRVAKADYLAILSTLYASDNRAMWTVTLTRADGRQIMHESNGAFPYMASAPVEPVTEEHVQ